MDAREAAAHINALGEYLGMRDIEALTPECLAAQSGAAQADLLILFGGSIACGADLAAMAMQRHLAARFMIVGGEGHTTQSLRDVLGQALPELDTRGRAEADVFADYLLARYGIRPDLIERHSTNCGNNVVNALALLCERGLKPRHVILMQDASMQRRMDAGFRKHLSADARITNYATYAAQVVAHQGALRFAGPPIWGMWKMERYISLLMGEIPRLRDDAQGYGPRGRGFIARVDVPSRVLDAFEALKPVYGGMIRAANPAYASPPAPPRAT